MLLGPGLLSGLAVAASVGGWWAGAGVLLAAGFAALTVRFPPVRLPLVRALVLLAVAVLLGHTLGAYLLAGEQRSVAVVVLAAATVVAAAGVDVPRGLQRAVVVVSLLGAAGFVALCVGIEPPQAVATEPVSASGWLPAGFVLVALATPVQRPHRRARAYLGIATGAVAGTAVAVAALYQLRPARLALSDAPLAEALVAADAAVLDTMLSVFVATTVLPALLATVTGARDAVVSATDIPPVRAAVACGVLAVTGAALADVPIALVTASVVAVTGTAVGWWRRRTTAPRPGSRGG